MQYSAIPFDCHATQPFAQLKQGMDVFFDMYLHCASELSSIVYHNSDMSRILVEDQSHYTKVYGLYSTRSNDSVVEQQSVQW